MEGKGGKILQPPELWVLRHLFLRNLEPEYDFFVDMACMEFYGKQIKMWKIEQNPIHSPK